MKTAEGRTVIKTVGGLSCILLSGTVIKTANGGTFKHTAKRNSLTNILPSAVLPD